MVSKDNSDRQDDILDLLRQRDERGMQQLFEHYGGALNHIITQVVPEKEEAEEVLHDSLMRIWDKVGDYEPDRSRLFTWMARITRNLAIDRVRSRNYRKANQTDTLNNSVSKGNDLSETMRVEHIGLSNLLTNLDDKHRDVIDLLYFKDYTQAETAKALDVPLGTVKTRARRALQKLRNLLKNELLLLILLLLHGY